MSNLLVITTSWLFTCFVNQFSNVRSANLWSEDSHFPGAARITVLSDSIVSHEYQKMTTQSNLG